MGHLSAPLLHTSVWIFSWFRRHGHLLPNLPYVTVCQKHTGFVDCCKGEVVNIIFPCDLLNLSFINYEKSHLHSVCDVCSPPTHSWSKAAKLSNSFCAVILRECKQSANAHSVRSDWKHLLWQTWTTYLSTLKTSLNAVIQSHVFTEEGIFL